MTTAIHTPTTAPAAHVTLPTIAALVETLLARIRAGLPRDASRPYRMRHEAALRGPLSDEIRRAGWL